MEKQKIDPVELNKLASKYFWEQKGEEIGWFIAIILFLGLSFLMILSLGIIFQGNEFICKVYSAGGSSTASIIDHQRCLDGTFNIVGLFNLGLCILMAFILLPLLILSVIGYAIYSFINSNIEKANSRALEELSTRGNKKNGTTR